MYSIKDAATKLNCKTNAIRFYEKKELLVLSVIKMDTVY